MKKKILFIETGMGFGGSAISLYNVVSNMKEYEPVIIFYAGRQSGFVAKYKGFNAYYLNAKITYTFTESCHRWIHKFIKNRLLDMLLKKFTALIYTLYEEYLIFKIRSIARNEGVSLVHLNNCIYPRLARMAEKLDLPVVVTLRAPIDCAGKDREAYKYINRLIAPTRAIRQYAIDKLAFDSDKIEVIYNSVNTVDYARQEEGERIRDGFKLESSSIVVGMFARIIPWKGQLVLAKAVDKLLMEGCDLICVFVGDASDGNNAYYTQLKQFIEMSQNSDRYVLAGYQENVYSYYNAVDIVVHPSFEGEAFGRIIIEAWASKKPIIVTDIAASVELVVNKKTGLIVSEGEYGELADAIYSLIMSQEFRSSLVNSGFEEVIKCFDARALTRKIEHIYSDIFSARVSE